MTLRKISSREKTRDVRFEVPRGHQDGTGMARGDHPGRRKQKEHEGEKKGGRGRVRGGLKVTGETMFTGKGKRPGTPYVRGQRSDALCRSQLAGTYFLLRVVIPRLRLPISIASHSGAVALEA